jgi:hypothetical protein
LKTSTAIGFAGVEGRTGAAVVKRLIVIIDEDQTTLNRIAVYQRRRETRFLDGIFTGYR